MKKKTLLIVMSSFVTVATAATVIFASGSSFQMNADGDTAPHQIILTAGNVVSSEDYYGVLYFEITKEGATRNGDDYSLVAEQNYAYGTISVTHSVDHIFTAISSNEYYAETYFGLQFKLDVYSLTNVVLHGNFYYSADLKSKQTSIEYGPSYLSDGYLTVYEDGLYGAELDSIEINYNCLI